MKKMTSRFNGKCRTCGEKIEAGTEILWSKAEGAHHLTCREDEAATATAPKRTQAWTIERTEEAMASQAFEKAALWAASKLRLALPFGDATAQVSTSWTPRTIDFVRDLLKARAKKGLSVKQAAWFLGYAETIDDAAAYRALVAEEAEYGAPKDEAEAAVISTVVEKIRRARSENLAAWESLVQVVIRWIAPTYSDGIALPLVIGTEKVETPDWAEAAKGRPMVERVAEVEAPQDEADEAWKAEQDILEAELVANGIPVDDETVAQGRIEVETVTMVEKAAPKAQEDGVEVAGPNHRDLTKDAGWNELKALLG